MDLSVSLPGIKQLLLYRILIWILISQVFFFSNIYLDSVCGSEYLHMQTCPLPSSKLSFDLLKITHILAS